MRLNLSEHYRTILASAEKRARLILSRQIQTGPNRGGFLQFSDGMAHPGAGVGALITLIPLYVNPDSSVAGSRRLAEGISLALEFAANLQRPDGTFDLLTSNFFSAPDNGFIMHNLARCYRILEALRERITEISDPLYELIVKAGDGLIGGGFHTPNHRWVNSAALAMAYNITGKRELMDEANRYLAEGIDVDENGEFTERSAGIYNAVNDNAFMILAEELSDPTLLDPVAKNLDMMFSYLEPDGSVFTWNSTRQDKGEGNEGGRFTAATYYPIYLGMLARRYHSRYAWIADTIFRNTLANGGPGGLYRFMLDPELKNGAFEYDAPEFDYEHHFVASNIVRIRRDGVSATILGNSSNFLFLQAGSLTCRAKLCASFFSVAQFKADEIRRTDEGYRMRFETHADYRLPLDPPPEATTWREIDHSKRIRVKDQVLVFDVGAREIEGGVELSIRTTGCDRVPVKLEMILSAGAMIKGDNFVLPGNAGGSITVESGFVTATTAADEIRLGPGFGGHWFTESMRGSDAQSKSDFTVYFTGYTPIKKIVEITGKTV